MPMHMIFAAAETTAGEELSSISQTLRELPVRQILLSVVLLAVCVVAVHFIVRIADKLMRRSPLDNSLISFLKSILRFILYFLTLLLVASSLGINVTSLVAMLSVISLAISLSVQGVLSNVAGGVMLLGTKPFKQGDWVAIGDTEGSVDDIGMVYTHIITLDNRRVMIPNSKVADSTIQNFTTLGKRRLDQVFSAAYTSPPADVRRALRSAVEKCGGLDEPPIIEINSFDDSSISYHVCMWVKASDYVAKRYLLRQLVWNEFASNGIEMTYPHLNVHFDEKNQTDR